MRKWKSSHLYIMLLTFSLILPFTFPVLAAEKEGYGPGFVSEVRLGQAPGQTEDTTPGYKRGDTLGIFDTTGYCNCELCSAGNTLTFSGTVPREKYTLSADLSLFPLGTRLMIGDVVYTVEDKGSSVLGNKLDIYYCVHEDAVKHGLKKEEVYTVITTVSETN